MLPKHELIALPVDMTGLIDLPNSVVQTRRDQYVIVWLLNRIVGIPKDAAVAELTLPKVPFTAAKIIGAPDCLPLTVNHDHSIVVRIANEDVVRAHGVCGVREI